MGEDINYLLTSFEVIKKYRISYQTLNYYTNLGLLVSCGRRGNKRLYDERKLRKRLRKIQSLKNDGYTLRLIRKILNREK
jgi:DNA-binding transcriptional MerR regulator